MDSAGLIAREFVGRTPERLVFIPDHMFVWNDYHLLVVLAPVPCHSWKVASKVGNDSVNLTLGSECLIFISNIHPVKSRQEETPAAFRFLTPSHPISFDELGI